MENFDTPSLAEPGAYLFRSEGKVVSCEPKHLSENPLSMEVGPFVVRLHHRFEEVRDTWHALEDIAPVSIYQCYAWQEAWATCVSAKAGHEILIAVGYLNAKPAFLLPFEVRQKKGLRQAHWLGDKHANYRMGLFDPEALPELRGSMAAILQAIANGDPRRLDIFILQGQPLFWEGIENPMTVLPHDPTGNPGASVTLDRDFEKVMDRGNGKRKRKNLRRQLRLLKQMGGGQLKATRTDQEAKTLFQVYLEQKENWFSSRGMENPFSGPEIEAFFIELSKRSCPKAQDGRLFQIEYLETGDGTILAIIGSGTFRGQHFGYFTSIHEDPKYATLSPGAFLFHKTIEKAASLGLRRFDFGIGDARYKASWCNETHEIMDVVFSCSFKGLIAKQGLRSKTRIQSQIRANETLFKLAQRLKRHF